MNPKAFILVTGLPGSSYTQHPFRVCIYLLNIMSPLSMSFSFLRWRQQWAGVISVVLALVSSIDSAAPYIPPEGKGVMGVHVVFSFPFQLPMGVDIQLSWKTCPSFHYCSPLCRLCARTRFIVRVECVFYGAARRGSRTDLGRKWGRSMTHVWDFLPNFSPFFVAFLCPSLFLVDLWLYVPVMFNLWTPSLWHLGTEFVLGSLDRVGFFGFTCHF